MEPEKIDFKLGTEKESFWTTVKRNVEAQIKAAENEIMLNKELLIVAERKIQEEQ